MYLRVQGRKEGGKRRISEVFAAHLLAPQVINLTLIVRNEVGKSLL